MSLLQQEQSYLTDNPGKTRADFVAWANETVYTLVPGKPFGYGTFFTALGETKANEVGDFLDAQKPRVGKLYINGNLDFGLPETVAMFEQLSQAIEGLTEQDKNTILDKARTSSPRIPGVSVEALEAEELEAKKAVWAALMNDVVNPNMAALTLPTEQQLRTFLGI